jgi:hypothetical protein
VRIKANVRIGERTLVGPNVVIGPDVSVAAGTLVAAKPLECDDADFSDSDSESDGIPRVDADSASLLGLGSRGVVIQVPAGGDGDDESIRYGWTVPLADVELDDDSDGEYGDPVDSSEDEVGGPHPVRSVLAPPLFPGFHTLIPRFHTLIPRFHTLIPRFHTLIPRFYTLIPRFHTLIPRFHTPVILFDVGSTWALRICASVFTLATALPAAATTSAATANRAATATLATVATSAATTTPATMVMLAVTALPAATTTPAAMSKLAVTATYLLRQC